MANLAGGRVHPTAFIVYDITKRTTFEHVVDRWLVQLKTHTHQSIVLCLLGNKCDSKDLREVRPLCI